MSTAGGTPGADEPTWRGVEDRIAALLDELGDAESLVVSAPSAGREVTTRYRSWLGREHTTTTTAEPSLEYVRRDGELCGTCVGGTQVGGTFPLDDVEHAALLDEGWRRPGSDDPPGRYVARWRVWLDPAAGADADWGYLGSLPLPGAASGGDGASDDGADAGMSVDAIAVRSAAALAVRTLQRVFDVTDAVGVRLERADADAV